MCARSTMAALLARLRLLVKDSAGASQLLSDDELQDVLDGNRQSFDQAELIEVPTANTTTGVTEYLAYRARVGWWETSPLLQDADWNTITPASSDLINGRWTLSTTEDPPCYITGSAYDIYNAAGDALLIILGLHVFGGWDAVSARYSAPRRDAVQSIRALIDLYRKLGWPTIMTVR